MLISLTSSVVDGHRLAQEKARKKLSDNLIKKDKRLNYSVNEFAYLAGLNQLFEHWACYDVSHLEFDLADLSWAADNHARFLKEYAIMAFGTVLQRSFAGKKAKLDYQQMLIEAKKRVGGLWLSADIDSHHWKLVGRRVREKQEKIRSQLKSVLVHSFRQDYSKACEAGTLGSVINFGTKTTSFMDWLKQQNPDFWHAAAESLWTSDERDYIWIASQPECDRATAAYIYMHGFLEWYSPRSREEAQQKACPHVMHEVVGERWNAVKYQRKELAFDLDIDLHAYQERFEEIQTGGISFGWLIDPAELVATKGRAADCPFFMHDHTAVFRSPEIEAGYYQVHPDTVWNIEKS